DSEAVQALDDGDTLTETFTVTTAGGDTETVTITINGTDDKAVITGSDSGSVEEDEIAQATGTLSVSDADADESIFVAQEDAPGKYGSFSVGTDGAWTYDLTANDSEAVQALDDGDTLTETFTVTTAGGDTETVTITINGTDDKAAIFVAPPVITNITDDSEASDYSLVTLHGTGEPGASITLYVISNSTTNGNNTQTGEYTTVKDLPITVDSSGNWTVDISNLDDVPVGDNEFFKAVQTDTNGNVSADSNTVHYWHGDSTSQKAESEDDFVLSGKGDDIQAIDTDDDNDVVTLDGGAGNDTAKFSKAISEMQSITLADNGNVIIVDDQGDTNILIEFESFSFENVVYSKESLLGNVTEDGILKALGTLTVSDADAGESSFNAQENTIGKYGAFSINAKGVWTYALNNEVDDVQALDAGQTETETFEVTTASGETKTVTITINGAEDAAEIDGTAIGSVTEDGTITTAGTLTVNDADAGESSFKSQENTIGKYGAFSINAKGAWTYALNNEVDDVQALDAGQIETETFTVTTAGGDTQTVTITINGTDDAAAIFVAPPVITNVTDDSAASDYSLVTLHGTGEPGASITLYVISGSTGRGQNPKTDEYTKVDDDSITVDSSGNWTMDISNLKDVPVNDNEFFKAVQTDTNGNVSTESNTVHYYHGRSGLINTVSGDDFILLGGSSDQVNINADDDNDAVTIDGGKQRIDTARFDKAISEMQSITLADNGNVIIVDDQGDTNTLINFEYFSFNDVVYSKESLLGNVTEDGILKALGTLTVSDADAGESSFNAQENTIGKYGAFSINAKGVWTYALNNEVDDVQALDAGQTETETFEVTTASGETKTVTITINGAEDAAEIDGTAIGSVTEDGTITTAGTLTVNDADAGESSFKSQENTIGKYGAFSINAKGAWTYALNNEVDDVQALDAGQIETETFTVTTAGGDTQTVTITINGTEDAAEIGGTDIGKVTEDYNLTTAGTLTVSDADAGESSFKAQENTIGKYGSFSINAKGAWTYVLNNEMDEVQAFDGTTIRVELFKVATTGGETQDVRIFLGGENDAPVAVDDYASMSSGSVITIDALDNDTDREGHSLIITDANVPSDQGLVEVVENKLVFTPASDFTGTASLTYTIRDVNGENDTDTANVFVSVTSVTVNSITSDDVINKAESDQTIAVTGTAIGGDIAEGDKVTLNIDSDTIYTTTVKSDNTWSVDVAGSDLAKDTDFDAVVTSYDEAGNKIDTMGSSTHTVDTYVDYDPDIKFDEAGNLLVGGYLESGGTVTSIT
ncbi:VCBS domain-containing protein, partial [Marinomonas sp. 2405UD68-3]|uniref:VCBS domain-containing protein n=1 Tax=Marinomonas sp. 2405UD68-3 TaxID=3391835 RepID=UPI0039C93334